MNDQSFDEDNHTVGRILSGKGGNIKTLASIMKQLGAYDIVRTEEGTLIKGL